LKRIFAIAAMALAALLVMASGAVAATTINPANAPSGTHLQAGAIGCTVGSDGSVTCSAFELGGVGHTNATVDLVANYSATIDCTNKGGSLVESHSQDVAVESGPVTIRPDRNGRLRVDARIATAPTNQQILQQADCPNPNWTPSVHGGSVTLDSFTYTLTFAGFTSPYITITGP
jgi:hypothetical protein